jgi:FkbM family methyltransferase
MNLWIIKVRSFARKIGVIGLINRLRPASPYERRVLAVLTGAVKPGDVVWDVGANVGLYSEQFCQWVGEDGFVVAFEPWAEGCERIRERLPDCQWLRVENIALGEADTTGRLVFGTMSVENHIETEADRLNGMMGSIPVVVCRGDTICNRLGKIPNVVKVDVEGYEEEVLEGMGGMLASPVLRGIMVEVHFLKLEKRGRLTAPNHIQQLLEDKGFRTRWVDASHLFATR